MARRWFRPSLAAKLWCFDRSSQAILTHEEAPSAASGGNLMVPTRQTYVSSDSSPDCRARHGAGTRHLCVATALVETITSEALTARSVRASFQLSW
jgi:hypothetical protein